MTDAQGPRLGELVPSRVSKESHHTANTSDDSLEKPKWVDTPTPSQSINSEDFRKDMDLDVEKNQAEATTSDEPVDPNVINWKGPDDPENPLNWPAGKRWGIVCMMSAVTFLTPLGSSMFAPGVPDLMDEFNSDNKQLATFVLSVYVLGFAFGPLIIAPLSEMYGRLPLYHISNLGFIIFNIACAVSSNLDMLIAFRFLAGAMGAAPLTLGGGTIADLISKEQRSIAMAIWVAGPAIGPSVGPVAGGFVSQELGWRWNFWLVTIASGALSIAMLFVMKETYSVTLLERKAAKLRKETGNPLIRSKLDLQLTPRELLLRTIVRPTKMLFKSPIVFTISLYMAISYAYLYILFTTFTKAFEEQYNIGRDLVGLCFVGIGVGQVIGQFHFGYMGNRTATKHIKLGDFKPEHRLPEMIPGAIALPIGLFFYAWTIENKVHWIAPIIGSSIFGYGIVLIFMPANTYLIDAFTLYAASAMAANTVFRSIVAAILPLCGLSLYDALGYGWGTSLLGFIATVMIPIPLIFLKYGEMIRTRWQVEL
ncbi:MFS general substrate transporter [Patellaria atrata CBS 101060]|uniref:MFS general substrate transporter n=1 Tax=Patellaria atrata CBS 101060 TaxID=1346257 RepID=A0A9P4S4J4_9PEZI|nr:MFS general substrate transporter [Patellaria atrata CBS 101060]